LEHPQLPRVPIRDWQLWNEQNSPTFYAPKPDPEAYARLLRAGREAIVGEDPRAEITLGGMFGTPRGGRKPSVVASAYLAELYELGARRDFDSVAAHPYAPTFDGVVDQVRRLRAEMRKADDAGAGLRITELGWGSAGPEHPLNRGRRGQAKRLRQAFGYLVRRRGKLNIRGVDWYSWRDTGGAASAICLWCSYSGLLDGDLKAKPALRAFTNFTGGT
jgi:hypothetical protein